MLVLVRPPPTMTSESVYRVIGLRIKMAREEANLTQEQLAADLGMSDSGLTLWESGKRRVPIDQLRRISDRLGKPMWWLMGEEPPDPNSAFAHELHRLSPEDRERAIEIIRSLRRSSERAKEAG